MRGRDRAELVRTALPADRQVTLHTVDDRHPQGPVYVVVLV